MQRPLHRHDRHRMQMPQLLRMLRPLHRRLHRHTPCMLRMPRPLRAVGPKVSPPQSQVLRLLVVIRLQMLTRMWTRHYGRPSPTRVLRPPHWRRHHHRQMCRHRRLLGVLRPMRFHRRSHLLVLRLLQLLQVLRLLPNALQGSAALGKSAERYINRPWRVAEANLPLGPGRAR